MCSQSLTKSVDKKVNQIKEVDLTNPLQRKKAVNAIIAGKVVAGHIRRVFGLWIDSSSESAYKTVMQIKGESLGKKMSIMTTGSFIVPHINSMRVKKKYRKYVQDANIFSETFGSLCHTILPIKSSSVNYFSKNVISDSSSNTNKIDHIVYNLDPSGHPGMEQFIRDLELEGIIPAVTSMNPALHPEITQTENARYFLESLSKNRPHLLMRDLYPVHEGILGSFAQIHLISGYIERDGHIPAHILSLMLGMEVNPKKFKKHKYAHIHFGKEFIDKIKRMSATEIRELILKFIHT